MHYYPTKDVKMAKYALLSATYLTPLEFKDIETVCQIPLIQSLVFPADWSQSATLRMRLMRGSDFHLGLLLPSEHPNLRSIYFICVNGMKFSCSIMNPRKGSSNTVVLQFTDEHISQGIISHNVLKAVILALHPVVQSDRVRVGPLKKRETYEPTYFQGPGESQYGLSLGWMTYYSDQIVQWIGRDKFDALGKIIKVEPFASGLLVQLTDEPFDYDNPVHEALELKVIETLELFRFVKPHPMWKKQG
jgi:Immunity protein 52